MLFAKKPGWYLQYRIPGRSLNETTLQELKATTEKEAVAEATLLWEQKEKRSIGGYNLRGAWTEEVFPNTPQLVYFSDVKFDCGDSNETN